MAIGFVEDGSFDEGVEAPATSTTPTIGAGSFQEADIFSERNVAGFINPAGSWGMLMNNISGLPGGSPPPTLTGDTVFTFNGNVQSLYSQLVPSNLLGDNTTTFAVVNNFVSPPEPVAHIDFEITHATPHTSEFTVMFLQGLKAGTYHPGISGSGNDFSAGFLSYYFSALDATGALIPIAQSTPAGGLVWFYTSGSIFTFAFSVVIILRVVYSNLFLPSSGNPFPQDTVTLFLNP